MNLHKLMSMRTEMTRREAADAVQRLAEEAGHPVTTAKANRIAVKLMEMSEEKRVTGRDPFYSDPTFEAVFAAELGITRKSEAKSVVLGGRNF